MRTVSEDVRYHISCLAEQGELLASCAASAGLDAVVPTCPGWQVRDLLRHTGFVHRWAAGYVAEQRTEMIGTPDDAGLLRQGPADRLLVEWFREGHAALVHVLQQADPELACWTFLEAPSALAFWARRQAHETTVHRADAQLAADPAARVSPVPPRLAADGVDELVMGFGRRVAVRGLRADPPTALGIHAIDAGQRGGLGSPGGSDSPGGPGGSGGPGGHGSDDGTAHWLITMAPDRAEVSRGPGIADCHVWGRSSDLYLMLWNRAGTTGLEVAGDTAALAAWSAQFRVTWT
jgi:uncharacterized protein (TIGR03083 family)